MRGRFSHEFGLKLRFGSGEGPIQAFFHVKPLLSCGPSVISSKKKSGM